MEEDHNINPNKKRRMIYLLVVSAVVLGVAILLSLFSTERKVPDEINTKNVVAEKDTVDAFASVSIFAKAAYVIDSSTGEVLYAKNEEDQLPLASITKLMTAIVVSEKTSPEKIVTISGTNLKAEGDSGLTEGEKWQIRDLLDFTLMVSSNDGASALASAAGISDNNTFAKLMNKKAVEIGLPQTFFINSTGLDTNLYTGGAYGSARDTALMLEYLFKNNPRAVESTRLSERSYTSADNLVHNAKNTNEIVGKIPGLIASKTGYTDIAGGNLVVAFDAGINRPIFIAVLGSSKNGRFKDMDTLVQATLLSMAF